MRSPFWFFLPGLLAQATSSTIEAADVPLSMAGELDTHAEHADDAMRKMMAFEDQGPVSPSFRDAGAKKMGINHWQELVDWALRNGGFVHPSLDLRSLTDDDNDDFVSYGVFTSTDLAANEVLLKIPSNLTINVGGCGDRCEAARKLHHELTRGNESFYAPYVNYLLDTQPYGTILATWSEQGKALFKEMTKNGILPPIDGDPTGWDTLAHCEPTPDEYYAFQQLKQVRRTTFLAFLNLLSGRCILNDAFLYYREAGTSTLYRSTISSRMEMVAF